MYKAPKMLPHALTVYVVHIYSDPLVAFKLSTPYTLIPEEAHSLKQRDVLVKMISVSNLPVTNSASVGIAVSECIKNRKWFTRWLTNRKRHSVASLLKQDVFRALAPS